MAIKKKQLDGPVKISAPRIVKAKYRITGVSPLICHKFSQKVRQEILEPKRKGTPKAPRDPEAAFRGSLYVMEDKKYGFPAAGFNKAIVRASKNTGLNMTDARSLFFILGNGRDVETQADLVTISGEPTMREDNVRVGGKADIRWRAEFLDWSADLTVAFDLDLIDEVGVGSLIERAGLLVGIGEWRPEKGGTFGRFTLSSKEDSPWLNT